MASPPPGVAKALAHFLAAQRVARAGGSLAAGQPEAMPSAHPAAAHPAAAHPAAAHPAAKAKPKAKGPNPGAPIVPGSSITNRVLGQQSAAAVTEKYGPAQTAATQAVGDAKTHETNIGGWYDAYLAQLAQHKANVDAANTQASAQVANLGNVTGPADSGPVSAGNEADAKNAAAVRSALLGALQGALVGQGQASSTYADTLAHVVGPGEKVVAQTGASQATTKAKGTLADLKREEGAYRTSFADTTKQNESKNVLAEQALGVQGATAAANAATTQARIKETSRHDKATEKNAASAQQQRQQQQAGTINKYGYSNADWAKLSVAQRQQVIKQFAAKPAAKPTDPKTAYTQKFYQQYGVQPASTTQVTNGQNDLQRTNSFVRELAGNGNDRGTVSHLLTQGGKVNIGTASKPVYRTYPPQKGLWLTVALDLAYNHYISPATADRLHKAGFLASQLNLPTKAPSLPKQPKPKPVTSNPFTNSPLPVAAPLPVGVR